MAFTPPASARSASPRRSPAAAWWIATSDDEHAVSTASDGPVRPSTNESRPLAVARVVPVRP